MTFNEHDVVRDNAGKFGEKPQSNPEAELPVPSTSSLDAAADAWAAKFRESEEAAVAYIETNVPDDIATVEFEWSDQGEYIEVTGYTMDDGTELDPEGLYSEPFGKDDAGPYGADDQTRFDALSEAGRYIEAPYERGLDDVNGDGEQLRLTITPQARAANKVTLEALEATGQAAIAAHRTREGAAVNTIRDMLPEGVQTLVLAQSDQGDFLSAETARDADGNEVELYDHEGDLWFDLDMAASHIEPSAGVGAMDAGIEHHPNHRKNNPLYIIRKVRS